MPFYTFRCPKCKVEKTVLQNSKDKPPTCKQCSSILPRNIVDMERVWSGKGPAIAFKGSGFYETDYKKPRIAGTHSTPEEALKAHDIERERDEKKSK